MRTRAAIDTRASTAPAGDQPAPISDVPNVPDVPNAAADISPMTSPAPRLPPTLPAGTSSVPAVSRVTVSSVSPLPGRSSSARALRIRLLLVIRDA